jgi:predicted PurR-regulated permease PerM
MMETNQFQNQWPAPLRYFAAILLLLGIFGVMIFIKPVFNIVALGFVFAFLLYTPIRWMSQKLGKKYALGVLLIYVLILVVLIFLIFSGLRILADNLKGLGEELKQANVQYLPPDFFPEAVTLGVQQAAAWFVQILIGTLTSLASLIGTVFVALFFSALLLLNLRQARGMLIQWIPVQELKNVRHILNQLDQIWVGFMSAQLIYGAVLAAGSWVEYALLGVPYALLMAVLTGLISLIPTIGGLLASLIVAIPCFMLGSTVFTEMSPVSFTLLVTVLNVVVTQVSYNFVALPVVGKFVRLPVAVVLIGVLAGVAMGNILLAFLVVPILSTLTIIGGYLLSKITGRVPYPEITADAGEAAGFFSQLAAEKEPVAAPK